MRFIIPLTIALTLSGCAQVGTFTVADATTAAAIDPSGAPCYQAIGAIGEAQANIAGKPGLLTILATKRAWQSVLQNPACAMIELSLFADLLKATPLGPFVP